MISRSIRSRLFSRRRLRNSSSSDDVRPSLLTPVSRSDCFTQLWIVCAVGSNSQLSSSGVRPVLTSLTICCRNSTEYGGLVLGIVDSFSLKRIGVHHLGLPPGFPSRRPGFILTPLLPLQSEDLRVEDLPRENTQRVLPKAIPTSRNPPYLWRRTVQRSRTTRLGPMAWREIH